MGVAAVPKQYLQLAGRTVLEWSLAQLLARQECAGVVVALSPDDRRWSTLEVSRDSRVRSVIGGSERALSVHEGLRSLRVDESAWVLVHDAARPCLSAQEVESLLQTLANDPVGGLLAAPVVDTLKRADEAGRVEETVHRDRLWRALTPQMFRYGILDRALQQAHDRGVAVTDEAQAVEGLGLQPRVVAGSPDNIKITLPEDLRRAERILMEQGNAFS
jgi:2-C-methyl-D-erythritol 4-phosphate cytidylyltransferase